MILLIVGISIFIAGMCVGAAFMFIYMTWDPPINHNTPYLEPDEIEQETGEGRYVPRS